jgi:hypothetical protein
MSIVIVAWGSLVPQPRALPLASTWQRGGPALKVEFSRVSRDARPTLVIDAINGAAAVTRYALSPRKDLGDAIADLRDREGTSRKWIGFLDIKRTMRSRDEFKEHADIFPEVERWLRHSGHQAAVWTALQPNFQPQTGHPFSVESGLKYLLSLPRSAQREALRYIREAPEEVCTPLRTAVANDARLCSEPS